MENSLSQKVCVPCSGKTPVLSADAAIRLLSQLNADWKISLMGESIERTFKFVDFKKAMEFVNRVAEISENEGHHPDIHLSYNLLRLEISTHAVQGLTENDFILAAKIDNL